MKELMDKDIEWVAGGHTNTSGGPTPTPADYRQLRDFISGFFAGFYESF